MKKISKEKLMELVISNIKDVKIQKINENQDFVELGMDSIGFIHLILAIEEEIGRELPDQYLILAEMNTVEKLYNVISLEGDDE